MKYCEYCNQAVDDNVEVCPCCGAKIANQSVPFPGAQTPSDNVRGFSHNTQSVNSRPQGYGNNPQGFNGNPQGFNYNPQGFNSNPQGFNSNPQGFNYNPNMNMPPVSSPAAAQKSSKGKGTAVLMIVISVVAVIALLYFVGKNIGGIDSSKKVNNIEDTFGTVSGNTYKNDFAGLNFTLPSDWEIEETHKFNDAILDVKTGKYKTTSLGVDLYYDMFATNSSTAANIIVGVLTNDSSDFAGMTPDSLLKEMA